MGSEMWGPGVFPLQWEFLTPLLFLGVMCTQSPLTYPTGVTSPLGAHWKRWELCLPFVHAGAYTKN